jgi:anhydro-N-acetylmuramic acid kinase
LLRHYTPKHNLFFTNQQGICPDSLEAIAFAWLAHAYDKKIFSNIPAVTGASKETVLGCAFFS